MFISSSLANISRLLVIRKIKFSYFFLFRIKYIQHAY